MQLDVVNSENQKVGSVDLSDDGRRQTAEAARLRIAQALGLPAP